MKLSGFNPTYFMAFKRIKKRFFSYFSLSYVRNSIIFWKSIRRTSSYFLFKSKKSI